MADQGIFHETIRGYITGWPQTGGTFNEDLLAALQQYCDTWGIILPTDATFNDYLTAVLEDAGVTYQGLLDNPSILNPIGG